MFSNDKSVQEITEYPSKTINNIMRHEHRKLEDWEKDQIVSIKDTGLDFINLLYEIAGYDMEDGLPPEGSSFNSRELALAATHIETAVMWAVKEVTK